MSSDIGGAFGVLCGAPMSGDAHFAGAFILSGIEVISGMFGGGEGCTKAREPSRAVMPAVAQAAIEA